VLPNLCEVKARPAGAWFSDPLDRFERLKLGSTNFHPVVRKDELEKIMVGFPVFFVKYW
jgi:hypothetical protein